MRRLLNFIAGMAVCTYGVFVTSSCSKDEFFGLEESEIINKSLKTEIALSQEFADYVIACINMSNEMEQPADTTGSPFKSELDGNPVYFKSGIQEEILVLMDNLKKAYPELLKADEFDFAEIEKIAFSKNKALKGYAPRKISKSSGLLSNQWLYAASEGSSTDGFLYEDASGSWTFMAHEKKDIAVSLSMWFVCETPPDENKLGGGLFFSDGSSVSMTGYGEYWPYVTNSSPYAQADFIVLPPSLSLWELGTGILSHLGTAYYESNREHLLYWAEH